MPGWKKVSVAERNYLMHDWSSEIERMQKEWAKRENAHHEKKMLELELAAEKLGTV